MPLNQGGEIIRNRECFEEIAVEILFIVQLGPMFGLSLSLSVVEFGLSESVAIAQTELGFLMKCR